MNPGGGDPSYRNQEVINLESEDLVTKGLTESLEQQSGLFTEFNAIIVSTLVLIPILFWTIKQEYSIIKHVPAASLKTPVIVIFLGPLLFQTCNLLSLYLLSVNVPILMLICKTYVGLMFYAFYYLLREVVFFEHLLQGSEAINAEPVFSDRNSHHQSVGTSS